MPLLYNMYNKIMFNEALEEGATDSVINGNKIRLADETINNVNNVYFINVLTYAKTMD